MRSSKSPEPIKEETALIEKTRITGCPLFNCPYADFTQRARREVFQNAIDAMANTFPHQIPVAVGDTVAMRDHTLARECPSDLKTKVADVSLGNEADAQNAMTIAVAVQTSGDKRPYANVLSFLKN